MVDSSDPYRPPELPPEKPAPDTAAAAFPGMQYFECYRYVFDNGNWLLNLLFGTLCQLIPIVGPLVLMGYQFEIVESLHRNPKHGYPDFNFDDFVEYLKRGLWPFLVSLVAGFVVGIPITIVIYAVIALVFVGVASVGPDAAPVAAGIGIPLAILLVFSVIVLLNMALLPMFLRAGLAQDFAEGFNFGFVVDFVTKTWKEMILSAVFLAVTAPLVAFCGLVVFCVGVYLAGTLVMLAYAHIYFQLYRCYLSRGGQPIPLKPRPENSPA